MLPGVIRIPSQVCVHIIGELRGEGGGESVGVSV